MTLLKKKRSQRAEWEEIRTREGKATRESDGDGENADRRRRGTRGLGSSKGAGKSLEKETEEIRNLSSGMILTGSLFLSFLRYEVLSLVPNE